MWRWGWRAYLGLGAVAGVAYYLVPPTAAKLVVWPLIGVSSAVATTVGARHFRPDRPLAWYLLATGQLALVLGDTLYNVRVQVLHTGQVFPSAVDLVYLLGFYPCVVAGLLLLIRRRSPGHDIPSLIDATIITTGLGLLVWVFLIDPYVRAAGLTALERLVSIAYPLGDVLVLAVATRLAVRSTRRPPAWWLLAAGLVALLAADVLFGLAQLAGTWQVGGPVDVGWMLFYLCFGAAALQPSMAALSEPVMPVAGRLSPGRLLLLASASLLAPAVLVVQAARGKLADVTVIALASAVLFVLALARMSGLASELALQQERKRAAQMVLRMTEEERTRLAAELHDGPVQRLTSLLYKLALARINLRDGIHGDADVLLGDLEKTVAVEIDGLRRLLSQLRPPVLDQLGIVAALRHQGEAFEASHGVRCVVDADLGSKVAPEAETVLYRVTQEALANVGKHAAASRVSVSLRSDDGLVRLRVEDDGSGFEPAAATVMLQQGHFGLASMRERVEMLGGQLLVDAAPGRGTAIVVELDPQLAQRPQGIRG